MIAMNGIDMCAPPYQRGERVGYVRVRRAHIIIAQPRIKYIAKEVYSLRVVRWTAQKLEEGLRGARSVRAHVDIRYKQYGHRRDQSSITVACLMVTSSRGTSECPPSLPVGTSVMLLTTSMPATTAPKTQ